MRKYRLFANPIADRTEFLNEMAKKGYRLTGAGSLKHDFESTSEAMEYLVQYIGHLSNDEREGQEKELDKKGFDVFYVPLNIKKYSFWASQANRARDPRGYLKTSFGMINRELRIVGRKDPSKPFPTTDPKRTEASLNQQRRMNIIIMVASALLVLFPIIVRGVVVPSREWALYLFGGIFMMMGLYKFLTVWEIQRRMSKK